jgi:uncharacterized protein YhaN
LKIKSLNIAAFGGLKNVQLSFQNGFNVVYGNNENGKTTIMNFIKMMFYGTERGSAQLSKNLRKKYTPWDNSGMAGSIDFENDGRNYRIERSFGSSNSTDKVTLIDLDLGTRETVSADIGASLFGLSSAAFERSIFIGQFGFPESNSTAEGEINSKLSNLTLTGDQAISFDEVNQRLQTAKFALMSKSGRAGIYDKNLIAAKELAGKIENAKQSQSEIAEKKQAAEALSIKITELSSRAEQMKTKIDGEQDFRNAEKLTELLALKEKLDALNETLRLENGQTADEMFVRKVEFCLSKIESLETKMDAKLNENKIIEQNLQLALNPSIDATPEKLEELTKKLENLEKEKTALSQKTEELQQAVNTPKSKSYIVFYALALVLDIVAAATFNFNKLIFGACTGVSVIFLILAIILMLKGKNQSRNQKAELIDLKLKENNLISIISSEKANITAINTALNSNASIIEKQKELLHNNKKELDLLEQEKVIESDTLFELFKRYKAVDNIAVIKDELLEISKKATAQKEIKQNINYILKDVGNISYDEARKKLANIKTPLENEIDFEGLKNQYSMLLSEITEQKTDLASLLTEIKSQSANLGNIENDKIQLAELKNKILNQKDYCDSLDIAMSVLADSFIEVRRSFGSVLEKKASDIFKGITGGKYQSMSISKSFEIAVEKADTFGGKEIDYLSSGTADQAYLSLRLAICELMAQDGNLFPVLLDDALAQYDDNRTKTALEFLNEYSKNGQIIMFTCHNSVLNASKESGANEIIL